MGFFGFVSWLTCGDEERGLKWFSEAVNLTLPIQRVCVECLCGYGMGVSEEGRFQVDMYLVS